MAAGAERRDRGRLSGGSSPGGTVGSLLAGRGPKRPKLEDGPPLQEGALRLLDRHQNLCGLLRELEDPAPSDGGGPTLPGRLLGRELRRCAALRGVSVATLSATTMLDRLMEVAAGPEEGGAREMLTSPQRVQLQVLLQSSKELLTQGLLCPELLWAEYRRLQEHPHLELLYFLHLHNILTLDYIVNSDEAAPSWLPARLKALCCWTPPPQEADTPRVQRDVLSAVAAVLVGAERNSLLDPLLLWLLDAEDRADDGADRWIQTLDASLCGAEASPAALQRFFTRCLTQTFTWNPRLTVSDAVALQDQWTLARADRRLTALYCKLVAPFSAEQLLRLLRQVLETHEVNWKHVLVFTASLLVYEPSATPTLTGLLSELLTAAFEGYDLEKLISAFLLARQAALEGAGVFPPYSHWFKMSFGGASGFHGNSKKSLVFLLKFLSDLVPFEPPPYLKVHILHPPYVPLKLRPLLMDYVTLAKTRLADLKESVEDMGLYGDGCDAGAGVQPQSQAPQDVQRALTLFQTSGRISAAVMEASIFRRPYFLGRFLPALLQPRALPPEPDVRMSFIEALRRAEKIPAAQYSCYLEACREQQQQQQQQQSEAAGRPDSRGDPVGVLRVQLQELTELLGAAPPAESSAQLARVAHTLGAIFPGPPEGGASAAVTVNTDDPPLAEPHPKVVDLILQNFCQCLLTASRGNPPNRQGWWASRYVSVLLANGPLLARLVSRLRDLLHHQGTSLGAAHIVGVAALLVHLQASGAAGPPVRSEPSVRPRPLPVAETLCSALPCSTAATMIFSVRLCTAAVSYGLCRGDSASPRQQQDFIPSSLYKKLLYLVPRLLPGARSCPAPSPAPKEDDAAALWSGASGDQTTWMGAVLHLWNHTAFQKLQQTPQYQLCLPDWLQEELKVQRHDDFLSDAQRLQYQQWALWDVYLGRAEGRGGCGGDARKLCSHLLDAVLEHLGCSEPALAPPTWPKGSSGTGTCLPDLLSRLQELLYEAELSDGAEGDGQDFVFQAVAQRCSAPTAGLSSRLRLQQTLQAWNRLLPVLPSVLFYPVRSQGGETSVDCSRLVEHINRHQRAACSPADVLPRPVTFHLLKGLLYAARRCRHPAAEVDRVWNQISAACPLLLLSAVRWWQQVAPLLVSLWTRLRHGEPLPEQLQLLSACRRWAVSLKQGPAVRMPRGAALVCAASLHGTFSSAEEHRQSFKDSLSSLSPEREAEHRQVLVSLLFLCMKDFLSALLDPQEDGSDWSRWFCSELLAVLGTADWLRLFGSDEADPVILTCAEDWRRLMPWAVCSLLQQQCAGFLQAALRCAGFLHSAILWYLAVMQLFLDGATPPEAPEQILDRAKQLVLCLVSQAPPAALSSGQLRQLERRCADLDPDLAAALRARLEPLGPEPDYL